MILNSDKIIINHTFFDGMKLEVTAHYVNKKLGGLYANQAYNEEEALNFIGDDDSEIPEIEPFVYLGLIDVHPGYRQNVIGTALMNYFFDKKLYLLFNEKNTYIKLDVHPQGLGITKQILKAFYSRYDFKPSTNNYMIRKI